MKSELNSSVQMKTQKTMAFDTTTPRPTARPNTEPFHTLTLHSGVGRPIKLAAAGPGQKPDQADVSINPVFAPCSLSDLRSEILRHFSSSPLPPSLASGRCTALSFPHRSSRSVF